MYVDPTPTKIDGPNLREDVILDVDMMPIFKGSPEEVKSMVQSYSPDYQDLVKIFSGRYVKVMSVTEYLDVVDLPENCEFLPLPKRKWNQPMMIEEKNMTKQRYIQGPEAAKMANLITDMTIAGASPEELERAVKHSMATISYEVSARENDIAGLVKKYQSPSARNARIIRRLLADHHYTNLEISEILEISLEDVESVLKGE